MLKLRNHRPAPGYYDGFVVRSRQSGGDFHGAAFDPTTLQSRHDLDDSHNNLDSKLERRCPIIAQSSKMTPSTLTLQESTLSPRLGFDEETAQIGE